MFDIFIKNMYKTPSLFWSWPHIKHALNAPKSLYGKTITGHTDNSTWTLDFCCSLQPTMEKSKSPRENKDIQPILTHVAISIENPINE